MKLYTEEQVLNSMKSVIYYVNHYHANVIDKIIDNHIKALGAVELPSDNEIIEHLKGIGDDEHKLGFSRGTQWVINQIKQQEDGK
jgi:hypothetical protein